MYFLSSEESSQLSWRTLIGEVGASRLLDECARMEGPLVDTCRLRPFPMKRTGDAQKKGGVSAG